MFENVDIHTYIRMTEAYLYYKLTNEAKGSGELKIAVIILMWFDLHVPKNADRMANSVELDLSVRNKPKFKSGCQD